MCITFYNLLCNSVLGKLSKAGHTFIMELLYYLPLAFNWDSTDCVSLFSPTESQQQLRWASDTHMSGKQTILSLETCVISRVREPDLSTFLSHIYFRTITKLISDQYRGGDEPHTSSKMDSIFWSIKPVIHC